MQPLFALFPAAFVLLATLISCTTGAAPETGLKAYNAAMDLHLADKDPEAEKAARALVAASTKSLGAKDAETLRARLLLATILHSEKRNTEAESLLRDLLTQTLGAEDVDTLDCRSELILTLSAQDKNAAAAAECRRLIPLQTKVHGADAAETLLTRRCLAIALSAQGKLSESEQEYRRVLALMTKKEGPENRQTLLQRSYFSSVL